ncbi:AraC family transcriptional regulator [Sphingomonas sp.]|uniref:helix-turn-helix domain-containing protein n=1 Tax=Sphingomonas sp. TaxID=28214 RepID=UPI0017E9DCE3|nr:AraC family transcriptional regulator [Sphingomonas sp.]MBA3510371.1 helix-turn-helix transcriptional regulator [Sphingomonas sp.]
MSDQPREIDQFLEAVEIRVEAFGVCEIGRQFSLRCEPFNSVVVHFVLSGEGFMECRHGRYPLKPGTAVVVPKKLPKKLSGVGPIQQIKDARADCTLQDGLVKFGASNGDVDLVLGCAELSSTVGGDLPLFDQAKRPLIEHSEDPLLRGLFTTMFDELRNPRLGTRAFVSALMKQVLIVLLRSQPNNESSILLMSGARLAGVVAAILDRPEDNHTVDSLAAMAGMSRSRFSHHFTLAYDCTPKAFVQTARLASAARMLKGSNLPVKSIAASVGYASRSHFSRAFQAKFGLDPSAFRLSSAAEQ